MVSEDHCVVLLLASTEQDGALIKKHLTCVDSTVEVCLEFDSRAILDYLKNTALESAPDAYIRPRLIILSIHDLSADVVTILEFLQTNVDTGKIPVVIFSENDATDEIKEAYNLKINSYLHKPEHPDVFAGMLKEVAEYWLKWNQLPS